MRESFEIPHDFCAQSLNSTTQIAEYFEMGLDIPGQKEKNSQGFIEGPLQNWSFYVFNPDLRRPKRLGVLIPTWFRSTSHSPHPGAVGRLLWVDRGWAKENIQAKSSGCIYEDGFQFVDVNMLFGLFERMGGPFHVVRILNNIRT